MSVLENFQEWKSFLNDRLDQAESLGVDNETISNMAYQLGDYLAKGVDPKNHQERVLKELWDVASEEEQHTIANLMVKLVKH
ncbi:DUF3243 domain-containing protein [Mechercharimyces sp. CAU 1602]|uniref:DUF3243 domain-containing protein n=1 Tax=Mechercharimyces sp. CAU 1602 TaxID=2973933 RepID=UPI002163981E|nr:DUF3243 domain-containing protein [Mechercharimyces sp. CAU 1602]MCS1351242.1 DUF3243 domain-containing protein [Mechercharimyces sp. CAU 1602]